MYLANQSQVLPQCQMASAVRLQDDIICLPSWPDGVSSPSPLQDGVSCPPPLPDDVIFLLSKDSGNCSLSHYLRGCSNVHHLNYATEYCGFAIVHA